MIIKSFLFRLYLFILSRFFIMILSPQFTVLLTWIIFMSYKIYFEPAILCDPNWELFHLKIQLTNDISYLRLAELNLAKYQDLDEQYREVLMETQPGTRHSSHELVKQNGADLRRTIELKNDILAKVTQLETAIKKLDPQYQSVIVPTKYQYVGRSKWI